MNQANLRKLLSFDWPEGPVPAVLDTDAFNEVDDQYAIAYTLQSAARIDLQAIYAAPFYATPFYAPANDMERASSPEDGMEKSYAEILHVLDLMGRGDVAPKVYKGARRFMGWAGDAVDSPAVQDMAARALAMPKGQRLYIVALGAITNVASALMLYPEIAEKAVVLWLGGHAFHWPHNDEFNCIQDPYAAKIVFDSGVPVIQFPCMGVVSQLQVTNAELNAALKGKNPLCDYLISITDEWARAAKGTDGWSKTIWDIAPVAWLVDGENWMEGHLVHSPVITNQQTYSFDTRRHFIYQLRTLRRDQILQDVFAKLGGI